MYVYKSLVGVVVVELVVLMMVGGWFATMDTLLVDVTGVVVVVVEGLVGVIVGVHGVVDEVVG